MCRSPGCVAVAVAILAGRGVVAADWTTSVGGNTARNGRSTESGPAGPDVLWQGARPAIIAQQGVCQGDLLVLPRWESFSSGGWIVGLTLQTGVELWAVQLPVITSGAGNHRPTGMRDGRIYATRAGNDRLEYLYALSPEDGSVLWRSQDMISESYTESLAYASNGDIIASRWDIFGAATNELLRIRATDGGTVWRLPRSVPSSNGQDAVVVGDRAYIWEAGLSGPVVTAFDIEAGARLYSSPPVSGGLVQQAALFAGPDGTIYAPRMQNNPVTDFFVAYDDTGNGLVERWRAPMGYTPFATHVVAGLGLDSSVYTYDTVRDGSLAHLTIRRRRASDGMVLNSSAPIVCDFPAGPRMSVDAGGVLYLTNGSFANGGLWSLNPDLSVRWNVPVANVNTGGPMLCRGGVLVVSGIGSNVVAYRTEGPPLCYANCDGSTVPPVLNVEDFTCFINEFAAGSQLPHELQVGHYANCDGSTTAPVLNVEDFTCFINRFAAGCR
jgi:outer membrane protein assembly factor BamB